MKRASAMPWVLAASETALLLYFWMRLMTLFDWATTE